MIFIIRQCFCESIFAKTEKRMKKTILLLVLAALTVTGARAQEKAKWKELDDFHAVMSATYHPSEEGKLQPIKTRSQEMLDKAIAWKKSTPPAGYDKNAVRKNLKDLVKGAGELNKMVKENAADIALKEKLAKLHDVFHEIVEKCEKEEHHM